MNVSKTHLFSALRLNGAHDSAKAANSEGLVYGPNEKKILQRLFLTPFNDKDINSLIRFHSN